MIPAIKSLLRTALKSPHAAEFLLELLRYTNAFLIGYKILCHIRIMLEMLPFVNPYMEPFAVIFTITDPYFKMWKYIIPVIRLNRSHIDLPSVCAIYSMDMVHYILTKLLMILYLNVKEGRLIIN